MQPQYYPGWAVVVQPLYQLIKSSTKAQCQKLSQWSWIGLCLEGSSKPIRWALDIGHLDIAIVSSPLQIFVDATGT